MRAAIISVSLACSGHETVEFQILSNMRRKSSGVHTPHCQMRDGEQGEAAKEELRNVIQGSREAVWKAKDPLGLMPARDVKGKKDDLLLLQ